MYVSSVSKTKNVQKHSQKIFVKQNRSCYGIFMFSFVKIYIMI